MSSADALVVDETGLARCRWAAGAPDLATYHDREWGRPVVTDDGVLERICLEGFQSGLSWLTILRKREGFRRAFARFSLDAVAAFGPDDVERLLGDASIVRHRAKIEATIANARAARAVREEVGSFARWVWSHADPSDRPPPIPPAATTPASVRLARDLKARGFRFVGPTTAYAAMQAIGLVNDHVEGCHVRADVAAERAKVLAASAPTGAKTHRLADMGD